MTSTIKNSLQISQIKVKATTPSTLLIPKKLLDYYDSRVAFIGTRKLYFQHLITTYGRQLSRFGIEPVSGKWKKEYQKEGLGLQARSFKPNPESWEEFRHIAMAYGLGMCKLFVTLLELEQKRWKESKCPEIFFENPPDPPQSNKSGRNSSLNLDLEIKTSLESLIKSKKCAVLIRSIDFSGMELERIALIRHE